MEGKEGACYLSFQNQIFPFAEASKCIAGTAVQKQLALVDDTFENEFHIGTLARL